MMKESNDFSFKFSVPQMCIIAFLCVIVHVISDRFGTYSHYVSGGARTHMEGLGIFIPLMVLIIPIFVKKFRGNIWNKKNLIMLFSVLVISIVLLTITYANKEYYWELWYESGHWDRDNCPPIRWDIWNIL